MSTSIKRRVMTGIVTASVATGLIVVAPVPAAVSAHVPGVVAVEKADAATKKLTKKQKGRYTKGACRSTSSICFDNNKVDVRNVEVRPAPKDANELRNILRSLF